ncbi:hypothetical protein [Streptomyces mirabilis]|uniref:hypothetical protein n=1 Tax=Streptomyces mirabilis TaxID=68239 RepID=UPI0036BB57A8
MPWLRPTYRLARAKMNTTISDRSSCSYESAFGLMSGGDLRDAHIDVAAVALDSRGSKDLTGANGVTDDHGGEDRNRTFVRQCSVTSSCSTALPDTVVPVAVVTLPYRLNSRLCLSDTLRAASPPVAAGGLRGPYGCARPAPTARDPGAS